MLNFLYKCPYQAGIQIIEKNIFCCLTKKSKNKIEKVKCYSQDYQSSDKQSLLTSLKNIRKQIPRRSKIILGLPNYQLFKKELSLDASLENDEILLYLKQHAARFFGHPYQKLYLDFFSLAENTDGEQTVLTASCLRETIDQFLYIMNKAKISVSVIDCNVYAILRAILTLSKIKSETFSVFHFDAGELYFRVYQNNRLYFESSDKDNDAEKLWNEYFHSTKFISFETLYLMGENQFVENVKQYLNKIANIKIYIINNSPLLTSHHFIVPFGLSLWRKHGI